MKISALLATSMHSPEHIAIAEQLGYDRAWLFVAPYESPDVWMMLALAAERTATIGLGPGVLVPMWAQALHRTVNDGATEDFASIAADTDGAFGVVLMFHKVPEGKTVKNRVHFDLQAADVGAEADRLTSLGAQQVRSLAENNNRWISFLDPEGNEFDLVASG